MNRTLEPPALPVDSPRSLPSPAAGSAASQQAPLSDALSDVVDASQSLVANRFDLMRLQLEASVEAKIQRVGLLAASGVLALVSYMVFFAGLGVLLSQVVPTWLAIVAIALPHLGASGYVLSRALETPAAAGAATTSSEGVTP